MPAHATSWGFAYEYLIIPCFKRSNDYDFNDLWADCPMDPTNSQVYTFLQNFLMEVSTTFPDKWLHLGGDEVIYSCWNTTNINQFMKDNGINSYELLEAYFIQKINTYIKDNFDRNLIYWQEVFQSTSPFIGTAVDVWKDAATLVNVIKQNINAIQSFGWYLDHLQDDWTTFYKQDPIPQGTPVDMQKYVLGGETSMWGESVDSNNIHQRIWPRASAVAERLWSLSTVTDATAAVPRLSIHRCRMVSRGIPVSPFQPGPGCYH